MKNSILTRLVGLSLSIAMTLPIYAQQTRDGDVPSDIDVQYPDRSIEEQRRTETRTDDRSEVAEERWRYRRHNDQWWYWHPDNYWLLWRDGAWRPYVIEPYRAQPRERLRPGRPANFYRDAWFYDRDRGFYGFFRGAPTGLPPHIHRDRAAAHLGAGWETGQYGLGVPTGVHTDPSVDFGFSDYGDTVLPGAYDRGIVR